MAHDAETEREPRALKRVCVFCGSRAGARPAYRDAAIALGRTLAERGLGLVYGGASVGLMGDLADAVLAAGGEVIGVIPDGLVKKELAHRGLTDLRVVPSMHTRKALMADLSDAFIAMPGGFGTFDELFEILTWAQIGLHDKAIGLLDVEGYFGPLRALIAHAAAEGFAASAHASLVVESAWPDALLDALASFVPPTLGTKWSARPPRR